jgi:uncharacterized protein (TIGR00251 family)
MKTRIQVKVKTRAAQSGVRGRMGDAIKIDVAAPPVEGRANLELIRLIAEVAGVPRSQVRVVTGLTNVKKLIEIEGIGEEEFLRRIQ